MALTEQDIQAARARMAERRDASHAVAARFDRRLHSLVIRLSSGVQLAVPVRLIEGLSGASAEALAEISISPSGLGLHWPQLDADVYVPALLQGVFGSPGWSAREAGKVGGQARSAAKTTAARENGKKGGRPPRKSGIPSAA